MGDEPVGDEDEARSVTVKMKQSELDELERRIDSEFNDANRIRKAVWLVNNASKLDINFDADENESGRSPEGRGRIRGYREWLRCEIGKGFGRQLLGSIGHYHRYVLVAAGKLGNNEGFTVTNSIGVVIPAYKPDMPVLESYIEQIRSSLSPETIRIEFDAPLQDDIDHFENEIVEIGVSQQRRGKGAAIMAGFDALETDIYLFADADGSVPATSLADIIQPIIDESADVSIGSRRHPSSDIVTHQTVFRRFWGCIRTRCPIYAPNSMSGLPMWCEGSDSRCLGDDRAPLLRARVCMGPRVRVGRWVARVRYFRGSSHMERPSRLDSEPTFGFDRAGDRAGRCETTNRRDRHEPSISAYRFNQ